MRVKSGIYTGNGTAQSISDVGFQPSTVIIKGAGTQIGAMTISSMGADVTKPMSGATAVFTGGVTSLDSGGFSVGADARVNSNTVVYYYIALGASNASDYAVGTYVGNGLDDRSITITPAFQPDSVIICSASTHIVFWGSSTMAAGNSMNIGSGTLTTDRIQAFAATGFQIGTGADTNLDTVNYYYVALKNSAIHKVITYTGTGNDGESIGGAGFEPDDSFTKHSTVATSAAIRFDAQVGDLSLQVSGVAAAANKIQAHEADGFDLGTHQTVNELSAVYHAFFLKDGTTVGGGGGGGGQGGGRGGGNSGGGGGGGNTGGGPGNGGGGGPGPKKDSIVASKRRHRLVAGVL
jgi:hypothetical protein